MRPEFRTVVFPIMIGCALLAASCRQEVHRPYLPLAGMTVTATGPDEERLMACLNRFSEMEHLEAKDGSFLKRGRNVVNMEIHVDDETFFLISNFNDSSKFRMNAYSHEGRARWFPRWTRLGDEIRATVGPDNVQVEVF